MATQHQPPTGYTSKDLTKCPLPPIVQGFTHTESPSISSRIFNGVAAKWTGFEMEVRNAFRQQEWKTHVIALEQPGNLFNREHVICANEIGVSSRFQQQVGHVMTCVGLDIGMRLYFGSWHGSGKGHPDLTIWDEGGHKALIAGEVKTPWTLNLRRMMAGEYLDNTQFRIEFPISAGQVAQYMKEHSCKYGFLTTYRDTVFFKQESYTFNQEMASLNNLSNGETITVLWYSNAIHHETASAGCDSHNPFHYTDKVSVRECFLFLMKQLDSQNHEFRNRQNPWTKDNKGKQTSGSLAKFLKFPAPSSTNKGATSSSAPQGYASSSQQQPYRSRDGRDYYSTTDPKHSYYTHVADPLAGQMSGLHLKERSSESASVQGRGKVTVRWDARRETYFYTASSGKQKQVETSTTYNGELWVKINGEKFRATLVS